MYYIKIETRTNPVQDIVKDNKPNTFINTRKPDMKFLTILNILKPLNIISFKRKKDDIFYKITIPEYILML